MCSQQETVYVQRRRVGVLFTLVHAVRVFFVEGRKPPVGAFNSGRSKSRLVLSIVSIKHRTMTRG